MRKIYEPEIVGSPRTEKHFKTKSTMASSLLSEIGESIPQSVAESFKIGFLGLFGVFNAYSIYNSLKQTPAVR